MESTSIPGAESPLSEVMTIIQSAESPETYRAIGIHLGASQL